MSTAKKIQYFFVSNAKTTRSNAKNITKRKIKNRSLDLRVIEDNADTL
jgi:hypothetical protein